MTAPQLHQPSVAGMGALGRGSYGWRARIGMVTVASTIETPLYELYLMAPAGVTFVSAGLSIRKVTEAAIEAAWKSVEAAAVEVAAYHVDHLIVSGAPLAYYSGPDADRRLIERVEEASGLPTTFELTSSVEGLRALGARRIAIATPFGPGANDRIAAFMTAQGFEVRSVLGLGYDANPDITRLPLEAAYQVSRDAWRASGGADAIYITCPRWPVSPIIEALEGDLQAPVVASMQSALWDALRRLDIGAPVEGFGRLLRNDLPS